MKKINENSTIQSQLERFCAWRIAQGDAAAKAPVSATEMASIAVSVVLIESASDAAVDLIPSLWAKIDDADKPSVAKANRESRAELAQLLIPFMTASSNWDKTFRKNGGLPERPSNPTLDGFC